MALPEFLTFQSEDVLNPLPLELYQLVKYVSAEPNLDVLVRDPPRRIEIVVVFGTFIVELAHVSVELPDRLRMALRYAVFRELFENVHKSCFGEFAFQQGSFKILSFYKRTVPEQRSFTARRFYQIVRHLFLCRRTLAILITL